VLHVKHRITSIGSRLREAHARAGKDNGDVAKAAGVHTGTVTSWRKDKFPPDDEKLEAIAALLGVSSSWLRYGTESVRELPAQYLVDSPTPATFPEHVLFTAGRIVELGRQIVSLSAQMAQTAETQVLMGNDLGRRAAEVAPVGPPPAPISESRVAAGLEALKDAKAGARRGKRAG
jgi:transcriptional regulator with XRE-family HTH domain